MHLHQTTMQSSLWFPLTVYVSLTDSEAHLFFLDVTSLGIIMHQSIAVRSHVKMSMASWPQMPPLTGYEPKVHDANVDRSRPLSQVNTRVSVVCLVYRKRCSVQESRFAQGSREQGGTLTEDGPVEKFKACSQQNRAGGVVRTDELSFRNSTKHQGCLFFSLTD